MYKIEFSEDDENRSYMIITDDNGTREYKDGGEERTGSRVR